MGQKPHGKGVCLSSKVRTVEAPVENKKSQCVLVCVKKLAMPILKLIWEIRVQKTVVWKH